ncbi:MAG: Ldh family oxidoreductase [Candidatus Latescibacterota bacterium]
MPTRPRSRNRPPSHGIRVPADALERLTSALFERAGMPAADAAVMAELLVDTDLHCVFSHGTRQIPGYLSMIRQGRVNPRPAVRAVADFPAGLVLDGDGGMGHLPCHRATLECIAKAREVGVAAATTANHFHFGAAGKYTRMALRADCIGIAMSSHRFTPNPQGTVAGACAGSPMSIAIPAGQQPPLVLDMGGPGVPATPQILDAIPTAVYKALGLSMSVASLGGILPGIYRPALVPPASRWDSNQGSFVVVLDVAHYLPVGELKAEMDRYIGTARGLQPLPGEDRADTAGSAEWEWAAANRRDGIPIGDEHRASLEVVAAELGVPAPFASFEATRF